MSIKKNSTVQVTRTFRHRNFGVPSDVVEETPEDVIDVHVFETVPAIAGIEVGSSMNLGNYESAHVKVSVQVPCYTEELAETTKRALKFARAHYVAEYGRIRAFLVRARAKADKPL